jgi:chromosomal replication initiator protein
MFVYQVPADANHDSHQALALWQACLNGLLSRVPQTQIDLWLAAIEPLSLIQSIQTQTQTNSDNSTQLLLTCQTSQGQKINAIVSQFQTAIEQQCQTLCGQVVEWSLLHASTQNKTIALPLDSIHNAPSALSNTNNVDNNIDSCVNDNDSDDALEQDGTKGLSAIEDTNQEPLIHNGTGLNSRLSFDRFVVGKANQMAHAAAQHVAANPGQSYNPLFLYGGVGLGKTHLAHAVGNAVLADRPNARIRYIHANQFIADVVASYRRQTFDAFKRYYHGLDLLLIDDIQFFADKKRTQEELFYAFEALVANRSQIILTSDTYPKDLADIESRLVSRFSAGLITAIDPPELEMRVAILHEKAKTLAIVLQEDVAFYIAKNLRSNVRELEGALHKLLAYSRFQNSHITLEMAKVALRDVISGPRGILSVEMIQKVVADYYKVKVSDLYGKRRLASFVLPRQVAMFLCKELTQKSLPDIGESFGGRDHTTVLHAVRKINQEKQDNPQLNHQIHVIQQTLGA